MSTSTLIDHGGRILYTIGGERSHMLHEVSAPFDGPPPVGYTYSHGYFDRDGAHWQYCTMRVSLPDGHERYWVRRRQHRPLFPDPHGEWEVVDELALGNPRAVAYADCQYRAQRAMDALVWALRGPVGP